jgi:hypothetical protein
MMGKLFYRREVSTAVEALWRARRLVESVEYPILIGEE